MKISKKFFVSAIVVGAIIIFAIVILLGNFWAAAFVNKSAISHSDVEDYYNAALHFYQAEVKFKKEDLSYFNSDEARKEIKKAVLQSLIEDKLIEEELNRVLDKKILNIMINEKIAKTDFGTDNFSKGVEMLYGLSPDKAKEILLVPKAKEEILGVRLMAENKKLEDWLRDKKLASSIIITLSNFYWEDGEVKID